MSLGTARAGQFNLKRRLVKLPGMGWNDDEAEMDIGILEGGTIPGVAGILWLHPPESNATAQDANRTIEMERSERLRNTVMASPRGG